MFVEIKFPGHCSTAKEKQEFVDEIVAWGIENLNDQKDWKYKTLLYVNPGFHISDNIEYISFNIENEADAMAIKLAWCET